MPDLSERIRDLVDAAIDPVTVADVREVRDNRPTRHKGAHKGLLVGIVTLAVAVVLVAVALVPTAHSNKHHAPIAAATQLRKIALAVERQADDSPSANQWLRTEQSMSIAAGVSQVGSTLTPDAQATINATITTWSNTTGQACISAATQPAQFATPANQAAWSAAGLTDQPERQPVTGCDSIIQGDPVGTLTQSTGVIDVSGLPTDPTNLANELETGTTGIPAVDSVPADQGTSAAFERAAILLIGPDSGTSSGFESALYGALASLRGIQSIGDVQTHSGLTGTGFSGSTSLGGTTIVVDPSNGSLLEARNVQDKVGFDVLSTSYPLGGQGIAVQGGSYGATVQWLDPVVAPTVVGPIVQPDSGDVAIFAIANLGETLNQVDTLSQELGKTLGGLAGTQGSASSAVIFNPHVPPATTANGQVINIGATNQWTFNGSTQTREWLTALQASGLFATILPF